MNIQNVLHENTNNIDIEKNEKNKEEFHDDIRDSEYEPATNLERFGQLKPYLRAIRVRNTIDVLLIDNIFSIQTIFAICLEILKFILFIFTIFVNINSCAQFSPTVLLVGGLFNLLQIAVLSTKKIIRG